MWPIGCAMFSQNITAEVRGDNVLLWKSSPPPPSPTPNPTPFIHLETPDDPWEAHWAEFIYPLLSDQFLSPGQLFAPIQLQFLSGLNSTNDSLALLGERLTTASSLSCAMLLQFWRIPFTAVPPRAQWTPVFAPAQASGSFVTALLVVQTLPLIIGLLMCSILISVFIVAARWSKSSDNSIQDGQVLNLISLFHHLSLPIPVVMNGNKKLQRLHAVDTQI
ncbi:hypothetical protein BS47DRAFT_52281 [Hydnum rufescens UP504]|uniref:Uncharacterized protein n=1 Tax=Hydnum rufescens UP504 TaxID=1448309 RepID=A0A9P6ASP6_9AGAM|nr:hypothetical protein BS47DRAFT_52281 [Hydnum rufescens UP504]